DGYVEKWPPADDRSRSPLLHIPTGPTTTATATIATRSTRFPTYTLDGTLTTPQGLGCQITMVHHLLGVRKISLERGFPGPSAGRAPHTPLDRWDFSILGSVREPKRWSWQDLLALPRETPTVDISCVTKWTIPTGKASQSTPCCGKWSMTQASRAMSSPS